MKHKLIGLIIMLGGMAACLQGHAFVEGPVHLCQALLQKGSVDEKKELVRQLGQAPFRNHEAAQFADGIKFEAKTQEASSEEVAPAYEPWQLFLNILQQQAAVSHKHQPFLQLAEQEISAQLENFRAREGREAKRSLRWLDQRYGLRTLERFERDWQSWKRVHASIEARFRRSHKLKLLFLKPWYKVKPTADHKNLQQAQKRMRSYFFDKEKLRLVLTKANIWRQVEDENILEQRLSAELEQIQKQITNAQFFMSNNLLQAIVLGEVGFKSLYEALSDTRFSFDERLNLLRRAIDYSLNTEAHYSRAGGFTRGHERSLMGDLLDAMLKDDPEAMQKLIAGAQFMQQAWLLEGQQAVCQQLDANAQQSQNLENKVGVLSEGLKSEEGSKKPRFFTLKKTVLASFSIMMIVQLFVFGFISC